MIYQFFVELVWDLVELCGSFVEFALNFVEKKRIYVEFRTPIPSSIALLTKSLNLLTNPPKMPLVFLIKVVKYFKLQRPLCYDNV